MRKKILFLVIFILILILGIGNKIDYVYVGASVDTKKALDINNNKIEKIEGIVEKYMSKGSIPGVAITVIDEENIYTKCFGYADIVQKKAVDTNTKFELGSNSKAFTGLAILDLVSKGQISLNDSILDFVSNISFEYDGKYYDITVEELLHHTSGIPTSAIKYIEEDESHAAFMRLKNRLKDMQLKSMPGEKYEYSTINYDILGLIIEEVTGKSFEEYVTVNVLEKLNLYDTFCITDKKYEKSDISKGYMYNWGKQKAYNTPIYRENIPAGYFISDIEDILRWLKIQLSLYNDYEFPVEIIQQSQEVNRRVEATLGASYAIGWENYQDGGGLYKHGGNNQYFSSYIIFKPEEKKGIAVLSNTNSAFTSVIANEISDVLDGKESSIQNVTDTNRMIDFLSFVLIAISIIVIIMLIIGLVCYIKARIKRKEKHAESMKRAVMLIVMLFSILVGIMYIPDVLGNGLTWKFIFRWVPNSIVVAASIGIVTLIAMYVYLIITCFMEKEKFNMAQVVVFLSIMSGAGNALIIFSINYSLSMENSQKLKLGIYVLIGLVLYVLGQKVVRDELIFMTNQIICSQRKRLVHKWLNTSFGKIQCIGNDKFQAVLNNDTEVISNCATMLITSITNLVTMTFCFVYLYMLNQLALLLTIGVIILIVAIYFLFGQYANRVNDSARNLQNDFFRFVNDLLYGIKELLISNKKRNEFEKDMGNVCETYKVKRAEGAGIYANLFIIGEMLFTLAVAFITFCFPFIIKNIRIEELSGYIFVLLYLTGPINSLLDGIPNIMNMNISWKRIKELQEKLDGIESDYDVKEKKKNIILSLEDIEYEYTSDDEHSFKIGPLSLQFKTGEITFITGGNGSGKSTLAKIIIGLYQKSRGNISINGEKIDEVQLREYYTSIFSDFHLFERLYGIDCSKKIDEIQYYLQLLKLEDKVKVEDGHFSTINLSTGQKKRLALLVSLLEDKEIYLFDEWAADQDPYYRRYFYETILPGLKNKGKCIIAITHDDKYFELADKKVKIEYGKIVNYIEQSST